MLKRAQRLAESQSKAGSHEKPSRRRFSSKDFSLRESPLTRILAFNVGRGGAASGMQKISAAAVAESGESNVHPSGFVAHVGLSGRLFKCVCFLKALNS